MDKEEEFEEDNDESEKSSKLINEDLKIFFKLFRSKSC
jgi:hypothetical protein